MLHGFDINIPYFTHERLDALLPLVHESYDKEDYQWYPPGGIGQHFITEDWATGIIQPFVDDLLVRPRSDMAMLSITGPNTWLHKHSDGYKVGTKLTIPLHPIAEFQALPYYDKDDNMTLFPMKWHQPCIIETVSMHGGFTTNDQIRAHLQFSFEPLIDEMLDIVHRGLLLRTMDCWISK